ncbi:ImmA/IrrE family metallo-endopeptidase [Anaerocolumna sp. AGMB13020]|uniref:ImmA/IrrE family metallo-endopeptidase n=1 Tax=Anaerocolumna sp. AGMB13020 TaxID=3081750 RepID=UPI0029555306|nr:ImmA/IrrE family metallo-endopeptidase [Anaerocolumna sp. AGMB13020]WOO35979.1 ImmA/IrrE family metallo-endopeptidase [Anaerocolumna sp. AGMB13020]
MNDIKKLVEGIKSKHKTDSPYELADLLGIDIHRCELGQIHGYYYKAYRVKQIYLNCDLSRIEEKFVLSHELGHSVLHPNANTPFLKANTYLSVEKMEIEANRFAMHLLLSDNDLLEYQEYSVAQLSKIFGYHERFIQLRLC